MKNVLIITSSGGGGLLQAGNAKEQAIQTANPSAIILKQDILKDWLWKPVGNFFINFWNQAQQQGNVLKQQFCGSGQFVIDIFFHPFIFFKCFRILNKYQIERVVDTQPLCTSAILRAIRFYNKLNDRNVVLEKIIVDLPTKRATHFFRSVKSLSESNKSHLYLHSIDPLLENGETEEQFWKNNTSLSMKRIIKEDFNVRSAFKVYKNLKRSQESNHLKIRFESEDEFQMIENVLEKGFLNFSRHGNCLEFDLQSSDKVYTILLGSQPARAATISYVKQLAIKSNQKTCIFVFCGNAFGDGSLFYEVCKIVTSLDWNFQNVSVIPFRFQKEDVIAKLFHRSDITCTRSGGGTAMELMCVSTGKIWIHSEAKQKKDNTILSIEELLKGIPAWESDSAKYMHLMYGAKIVTPDIIPL